MLVVITKINCRLIIGLGMLFSVACNSSKDAIRIKGSDTEVNVVLLLCEAFFNQQQQQAVSISGGGSGLGIATLLNGQADVANSSRPMSETEKQLFAERKIKVIETEFAQDALVIITHKDNPIDSLTLDELGDILSGKRTYWTKDEKEETRITIYGRQNNSGTHGYLKKKLGIDFSTNAKEMNGNAQIVEAVKADKTSIGYVGAGYILKDNTLITDDIHLIRLKADANTKAYSPLDTNAVEEHRYVLQRPLYQYILQESYKKVRPFLAFEQSDAGRKIITSNGYYTITK